MSDAPTVVADWTTDPKTGQIDSSLEFQQLVFKIRRMIRGSADDLLMGRLEEVAKRILSDLAHINGLAPQKAVVRSLALTNDGALHGVLAWDNKAYEYVARPLVH